MRRFFLVIAILGVTFAQTNLAPNPGFENWDDENTLSNWTYESGITVTRCSNPDSVFSGTYSAEVILTTQDQGSTDFTSDFISVNPNVDYTFSLHVYDNDPAGKVRLVIYWYDSNQNSLPTSWGTYSSDQSDWQVLTYTATSPSNAAYAKLGFRFYDVSSSWDGDAIFHLDEMSFTPPSNNPPTITNITQTPSTPTSSDNVTVTADISDPDGDNIAKDSLYYRVWQSGSWGDWTQVYHSSTGPYTYTIPAQSNHDSVEYYIIAEDDQGNRTESSHSNYYVCDDPVIQNIQQSPSNPTSSDMVTVTADITDPNNDLATDSLFYSTDGGNTYTQVYHTDVTGNTYTYQIPAQSDGTTVQYYIMAKDNQGNRSTTSTYSYTVSDLLPPVINEIMYNPVPDDNYFEYVEIYNPNNQPYDVGGWVLTGSITNDFTIPSNTSIPPYGFLVIAKDTDSIRHFYGQDSLGFLGDGDDILVGNGTFYLGNGGDSVILKDNNSNTIDEVDYDDASPWPTAPDGDGPSLALKNPDLDNSDPSNWCSEAGDDPTYGGTPGSENECGNAVLNSGFENWANGTPDSWIVESGASITENTTDRHRGHRSASLSVTTDSTGVYQNIEQVVGGNTYYLTAWVKASGNVHNHPSTGIELLFYNGNWNYDTTHGPFYPSSSGGWQRIAIRDTIPGNATKMRIHIIGFSTGKGAAGTVDAVSLISAGAIPTSIREEITGNIDKRLKVISIGNQLKFIMKNTNNSYIEIFNVAGRRIYKNKFASLLTLNSKFFRKGVYFAIVKSGDTILARAKFVVLR